MLSPDSFFSFTCSEIGSSITHSMIFPGTEVRMAEPAIPWIVVLASVKMGCNICFLPVVGDLYLARALASALSTLSCSLSGLMDL